MAITERAVREKTIAVFEPTNWYATLAGRIRTGNAQVAVLGLGYAGLPMAVELAHAGFPVTGIDIDQGRVDAVTSGVSPVSDVSDGDLAELVTIGQLRASSTFDPLADADCAL